MRAKVLLSFDRALTKAFTEIERGTGSADDVDITKIGDGY